MNIYSQLRPAIREVALVAGSDFPSMLYIYSHMNGSEPVASYASINILDVQQIGHHSTPALTRENKILDIRVVYEVMVQFSFFGSSAGDAAHSFTQRINNNPLVFEELSKQKLGIMRKTTLRRNPQKRDTKWVEAFNMDITFSYIVNTPQEVDVVEVVILQDEYSGDIFTVPPDAVITP